MVQPPGFFDPARPKHVCKLHRSIVGLQFHSLNSPFVALGFSCSRADSSMFIYRFSFEIVILLLDIILTGSSLALLRSLISRLSSQFSMKDRCVCIHLSFAFVR